MHSLEKHDDSQQHVKYVIKSRVIIRGYLFTTYVPCERFLDPSFVCIFKHFEYPLFCVRDFIDLIPPPGFDFTCLS